jgi:hypothetical protein
MRRRILRMAGGGRAFASYRAVHAPVLRLCVAASNVRGFSFLLLEVGSLGSRRGLKNSTLVALSVVAGRVRLPLSSRAGLAHRD